MITLESIKDALKENINTKLTNPFFGTLIIVWLFHNWELLVTIINISDYKTIELKINAITSHFSSPNDDFFSNLFYCIGFTFIAMTLSYLLLVFSKIVNIGYDNLIKIVYSLISKKDLVDKEDFEKLKKSNDLVLNENEELKKKNREFIIEKDAFIKNIEELKKQIEGTRFAYEDTNKKLENTRIKYDKEYLENKNIIVYMQVYIINELLKKEPDITIHVLSNLLLKIFNFDKELSSKYSEKFNEIINTFIQSKIININNNPMTEYDKYELTEYGKNTINNLLENKIINQNTKLIDLS